MKEFKNHTFIVTAYKESKYLEECIKSLVNQTIKSNIIMSTSTPNEYINSLAKKYDIKLETKNAKYLLALNNSVENIDYYVEAVYEDKITKKTFDGMNIVKIYPSKLDTVTDLTIESISYSSNTCSSSFFVLWKIPI